MSRIYDCADETARKDGIADAASAVRRGELVVLPTDTVYGIGADAFNPKAVAGLLAAKGRGREMPPPVLVGSTRAAMALVDDLGRFGRDLMDEFWPGPLTLVCAATPSLSWDLGDTKGTVAVRMPMDQVALDLLRETGPMAVSSANKSGSPAATEAADAVAQLGEEDIAVYLDGGATESSVPSTIVDLTYAVPRVLRSGAISIERLREVCGTVIGELRKGPARPKAGTAPAEGAAPAGEAPAADTAPVAEAPAPAGEAPVPGPDRPVDGAPAEGAAPAGQAPAAAPATGDTPAPGATDAADTAAADTVAARPADKAPAASAEPAPAAPTEQAPAPEPAAPAAPAADAAPADKAPADDGARTSEAPDRD